MSTKRQLLARNGDDVKFVKIHGIRYVNGSQSVIENV